MKSTILSLGCALALAAAVRADSRAAPDRAAHAARMRDRLPLVVFVGPPAREVTGARSISVATFPDAAAPSVVIGVVRDGQLMRKDLGGTPATPDIQAAVAVHANPYTGEALDEVNATRAARGLRPFIRDD